MRRAFISCAAIGLALASLAAGQAQARTWTVPGDFAEIQDAIDASTSGDTVLVLPGRYVGTVRIQDKRILLRSSGGPGVTELHGTAEQVVLLSGGGELDGFTVTNRDRPYGGAISCFGRGPIVRNNIIEGNREGPDVFEAGISGPSTDALVEGNVFRGNFCSQFALLDFYNLGSEGMGPPRVVNNLFVDNDCEVLSSGGPIVIANNTFVGNRVGYSETYPGPTVMLRNNLFTANGVGLFIDLYLFGDPVVEHNLVFANGEDWSDYVPPAAAGNLSVDPRLIDLEGRDLRLRPDSPAIDAGLPDGAPSADFAGVPRPLDGDGDGTAAVDIGAFEFAGDDFPTFTPIPSPTGQPSPTPRPTDGTPSPFGPFPPDATIFVAAANAGLADGSPLRPFRSIQQAIDSATGAAVVGVAAGTYRELVTMRRQVSVKGVGADSTVIDAGGGVPAVRCGDQTTLEGFTIRNAAGRGVGAVACGPAVTATIARNRIVDNDSVGVSVLQSTVAILDNQIVAEPEFTSNCPCDAITASISTTSIRGNDIDAADSNGNVSAIDLSGGHFDITRNRVVGRLWVSAEGPSPMPSRIANNLVVSGNGFSEAINLIATPPATLIVHNTIVGGGGIYTQHGGSARIIDNIIAFGTVGISGFGPLGDVELRHNLVFGNRRQGSIEGTNYEGLADPTGTNGNRSVDPLLVDRDGGDYRLTCRSPAVDAGEGVGVEEDLDGEPRPFDANGDGAARVDIGADEYVAARPFGILRIPGDYDRLADGLRGSIPCDALLVGAGTYRGSVNFAGKDVDVRSVEGAAQTIIEGDGGPAVTIGPAGQLRGFTVRNAVAGGAGAVVRGAGSRLRNNLFDGMGVAYSGIVAADAAPTIDANVVRDNVCAAGDPQGAISVTDGGARITNNVVTGNGCAGVSGRGGFLAVLNNTLVGNSVGIDWTQVSPIPIAGFNNIIAANGTGVRTEPIGGFADERWKHNLFFDNGRDVEGVPPLDDRLGNRSGDPRFNDPAAGDFRLRPDSAAIDAGNDAAPPFDYAGLVRPADGDADGTAESDIGAHEFAARAACTGDCNGDGRVSISELISGVGIALGQRPLDNCAAFDQGEDGRLSIDDLIGAVAAALNGC